MVRPRKERASLRLEMLLKYIQDTHHHILRPRLHMVQVSRPLKLQLGPSQQPQLRQLDSIHLLTTVRQGGIHSNLQLKRATRVGSTLPQGLNNHQHRIASHHTINSMASPVTPVMPIIRTGATHRQGMGVITRAGATTTTTKIESMYVQNVL
jgi:hypothetical protein